MDPAVSAPVRSRRAARTRAATGDEREQAILATAERLLAVKPLAEISIDELAKGAGISRPTFYFYFASKELVLLALLDRVVSEARARRDDALDRLAEGPERGWRDAIGAFCATFAEHRAVTAASAVALHTNDEVRAVWSRVMEGFVADTAAAIEAERRRGAAPDGVPARDLAISLNWMVERVLVSTHGGQEPAVPEDRLLDTLLAVFLGAIYRG
ncbi:TetR/AcrR family transcriptional regulator [Actinocorallia sp. API 0066]|uniref:TetR/AcrR family transcriptional regulator n=1 Tax=Actinocorallia sp. API 0066 TaxID=2896846 RepID=UPI001E40E6C9|nr:TetR/AcrR family transcriptional regulator [Actinocorallia sp. API 0066]MCD0451839.1 TetR/AcrR family transcriptional regulator [Actinocorallia sp. API 0066]